MSALLSQNYSKEGGVFYRDSNMNEVDVLIKEEGEITALAVKSSCHFERSVVSVISSEARRAKSRNLLLFRQ